MVIHRGITKASATPKITRTTKEKLFIGTLGVNCLDYTRRCIDTVVTSCSEVRFAYIDNGSKPESVEKLKGWKKKNDCIDQFVMGFNGYNAGVAVGWNQLIKMALAWGATKILICNNDIAFGPKTIDGLVEAYDRLRREIPETVMVTAANRTKSPSQLSQIQQEWKYQEHPDFSCFMITPEFIDRIGYFSEDYKPAFFEDNDTHWRILMTGYKAYSTDWAPYSHIASRTRYENPDIVPHLKFRENKVAFLKKMITDSVDQSTPEARYKAWIEKYPSQKHPTFDSVMDFCVRTKTITEKMIKYVGELTTNNVPR